jgi:hypothetical protein
MESNLAVFGTKSSADFIKSLTAIIDSEVTNDFWEITVPNKLPMSSSKNNALRNAFFAILIRSQLFRQPVVLLQSLPQLVVR